jgi:hypothetical protein
MRRHPVLAGISLRGLPTNASLVIINQIAFACSISSLRITRCLAIAIFAFAFEQATHEPLIVHRFVAVQILHAEPSKCFSPWAAAVIL